MKEYSTKDIRNVVLLGATKSGKTTMAESILYVGKVIDRKGTIEDKNTTSDYEEIEKLNQRMSICHSSICRVCRLQGKCNRCSWIRRFLRRSILSFQGL